MPKILATLLTKEKKAQAARKLQLGPAYQDLGLVCCKPDGKPWDLSDLSHKFRAFIDKTSLPRIRFHDLRHTYVTIMAEEVRVSINIVADLARHYDPGFTARTYVHPSMNMYYQAVDQFEAYILSGFSPDGQKENQLQAGQN
jgi:integrase